MIALNIVEHLIEFNRFSMIDHWSMTRFRTMIYLDNFCKV